MFCFGAECFENVRVVRCRLWHPCYPLIRLQALSAKVGIRCYQIYGE
jgi:hypothetical protein